MGWSTYFAFIFAAINTLTVTYFLAIENYPILKEVFPTFVIYVVITTAIGIPLLTFIGYVHYKRTAARRAEVDIGYETNVYQARTLVNSEISVKLNMKLLDMIIKMSKNKEISHEDYEELTKLQKKLTIFTSDRTFKNKMDLQFLTNEKE
jgi:hypothetical protein